jgi:hypothetical protein
VVIGAQVDRAPVDRRAVDAEGAERDRAEQQHPAVGPGQHPAGRAVRLADQRYGGRPSGGAGQYGDPGQMDAERHIEGGGRHGETRAGDEPGAVPGVQPGHHRPGGPAFQLDTLHVERDVHDAVRGRPHRDRRRQQAQRRSHRDRRQAQGVAGEAGPQAGPAAVPAGQHRAGRQTGDGTRFDRQHDHGQVGRVQPQPILHRRDPGRPGRGDQPGQREQDQRTALRPAEQGRHHSISIGRRCPVRPIMIRH